MHNHEPEGYVNLRYKKDNLYLNHKDTHWPIPEEKLPYAEKLKRYFAEA